MVHTVSEKMLQKCRKNVTKRIRKCYTASFQKIHFCGFPIKIGSSLLATQLVTLKSAKTTK